MKNLYLLLLLTLVISSCSKNIETSKIIQINGNIIEIQGDFLKFESLEDFYEIVNDFYENGESYSSYFKEHRPIENSLIQYDEFLDFFEGREWKNKSEVLTYIEKNEPGVKYEDSQFMNLFVMDYKNLFCNLDGLVRIGDVICKYDDEGRYEQDISTYTGYFDVEKAEYKSLKKAHKNRFIGIRSDFGGGCIDEVQNLRIKCTDALDFELYESSGCVLPFAFNSEFVAQAEIRFQRSTWLGWVRATPDRLRIEISIQAYDENGNIVLSVIDVRENTNNNNVKWGSVDSYCVDCNVLYTYSDYEFDFEGQRGGTTYACEHDIFLNVFEQNLCTF